MESFIEHGSKIYSCSGQINIAYYKKKFRKEFLLYKIKKLFRKKYRSELDINTMVTFDYDSLPKEYWENYLKVFPKDEIFVFMGELVQMRGHCVVCNYKTGKMICGYHTDNFIPLTVDDI